MRLVPNRRVILVNKNFWAKSFLEDLEEAFWRKKVDLEAVADHDEKQKGFKEGSQAVTWNLKQDWKQKRDLGAILALVRSKWRTKCLRSVISRQS